MYVCVCRVSILCYRKSQARTFEINDTPSDTLKEEYLHTQTTTKRHPRFRAPVLFEKSKPKIGWSITLCHPTVSWAGRQAISGASNNIYLLVEQQQQQ